MIRYRLIMILIGVVSAMGPVHVAKAAPHSTVLHEAYANYEQAMDVYRSDPLLARSLFAQAAAGFTQALTEIGESAELYRAIGNATLLSEQTGQAILALNRALVINPRDAQAREALKAARGTVQINALPSPRERTIDIANSWRRFVPPMLVQVVFLGSWTILWACIARSRAARVPVPVSVPVIATVFALLSASALLASEWDRRTDTRIVILSPTFGFNGPSRDVYESTFEQTIPPGTEARAIESRKNWTRVRLRSGVETWIPDDTFEAVRRATH